MGSIDIFLVLQPKWKTKNTKKSITAGQSNQSVGKGKEWGLFVPKQKR